MKRYFKASCNIGFGPGHCYNEFDGEEPTRQVEIYPERCFSSLDDDGEWGGNLCDQPLSEIDLSEAEEISEQEFEKAWNQVVKS